MKLPLWKKSGSRRSFSQLGSFETSRTNEPSRANVNSTCVRSRSWASAAAAIMTAGTTTYATRRIRRTRRDKPSLCGFRELGVDRCATGAIIRVYG